eukprot:g40364.t1
MGLGGMLFRGSLVDWSIFKAYAAKLNEYATTIADFICHAHINSNLPDCLDPLYFVYWHNKSMSDAISLDLHSSLEYLDNKDTYISLLLIDYSSASNTIIPNKLISKHQD